MTTDTTDILRNQKEYCEQLMPIIVLKIKQEKFL